MIQYDAKLSEILRNDKTYVDMYGIKVQTKKIPDEDRPGHLDPREVAIRKKDADFFANGKKWSDLTLEDMRDMCGFPNLNMNTVSIITKYEEHDFGGNTVGIWSYCPRELLRRKDLAGFIFIHGGGWAAGSTGTVENPCKLIAERAGCVVFNIDYSLAPEKPYPNGFNDCFHALEYIYANSEKYGVDKNKIGMGGDSAGGNLTAACALKDRDLGTHMLKYEALIYPAVSMVSQGMPGCEWKLGDYEICEEQREMIDAGLMIGRPKGLEGDSLGGAYLQHGEDPKDPYISPMFASSLKEICKTLIADAEFDGLRIQDENYAKMLMEAGVETRVIRYKGVGHAYIDKLGILPQAEDLMQEIADDLKAL